MTAGQSCSLFDVEFYYIVVVFLMGLVLPVIVFYVARQVYFYYLRKAEEAKSKEDEMASGLQEFRLDLSGFSQVAHPGGVVCHYSQHDSVQTTTVEGSSPKIKEKKAIVGDKNNFFSRKGSADIEAGDNTWRERASPTRAKSSKRDSNVSLSIDQSLHSVNRSIHQYPGVQREDIEASKRYASYRNLNNDVDESPRPSSSSHRKRYEGQDKKDSPRSTPTGTPKSSSSNRKYYKL